jgi:hypothetical protein
VALPIMPGGDEASDYVGLIDYDVRRVADSAAAGTAAGAAP